MQHSESFMSADGGARPQEKIDHSPIPGNSYVCGEGPPEVQSRGPQHQGTAHCHNTHRFGADLYESSFRSKERIEIVLAMETFRKANPDAYARINPKAPFSFEYFVLFSSPWWQWDPARGAHL
jgi:hypothetical protein